MAYELVVIQGRVASDVEMRYTGDGTPFTTFSMAVDVGYGDNKTTHWYRVTAWRKTAEIAAQYLKKGREVLVEGTMNADKGTGNPRVWTDKSGNARASYEINANHVVLLGSGGDNSARSESSDDSGNDIPF